MKMILKAVRKGPRTIKRLVKAGIAVFVPSHMFINSFIVKQKAKAGRPKSDSLARDERMAVARS